MFPKLLPCSMLSAVLLLASNTVPVLAQQPPSDIGSVPHVETEGQNVVSDADLGLPDTWRAGLGSGAFFRPSAEGRHSGQPVELALPGSAREEGLNSAGRPRGGVGGISSVLMSARGRNTRGGSPAIQLEWKDSIPPSDLVQYRILRSGSIPVDGPSAQLLALVLGLAAVILLLRRPRAGVTVGLLGAGSLAAWAAGSGVWSPPTQPIGTSLTKSFVDQNPLPDYNTYRVIAERTAGEPLPSNTGGAFLDGADGLTLEPSAQAWGSSLSPDGSTLVLLAQSAATQPVVHVLSLPDPTVFPPLQLEGQAFPGGGPFFSTQTAFLTTDTSVGGITETTLTAVTLANGSLDFDLELTGAPVDGVALAVQPGTDGVAVPVQAASQLARLHLVDPNGPTAATLDQAGTWIAGLGPQYSSSGDRVVSALTGNTVGTLWVVDSANATTLHAVPLSGQPIPNLPILLDTAAGLAYVPVQRQAPEDAVDQIDLGLGTLRQSLELPGKLIAPAGPVLLGGNTVLAVPVQRAGQPDQIRQFTNLGLVPASFATQTLTSDLVPEIPPALSPDGETIALLQRNGLGPMQVVRAEISEPNLEVSADLPGEPIDGVGPVFDGSGTALFVPTQGQGMALLTRIPGTGPAVCSYQVDGTLVEKASVQRLGNTGTAALRTRKDGLDLLTSVRELPPGLLLLPTASLVSGSRMTLVDMNCEAAQFLLVPGTLQGGGGPS